VLSSLPNRLKFAGKKKSDILTTSMKIKIFISVYTIALCTLQYAIQRLLVDEKWIEGCVEGDGNTKIKDIITALVKRV
jgi:hypothetical protein